MATTLYRLSALCLRHRRVVLAVWLSLVVLLTGGYLGFGGKFDNEFTIPGSEAQQALTSLQTTMPAFGGSTAQIVFVAPEGTVANPVYAAAIKETVANAAHAPQVSAAIDPFTAQTVSMDKRTAIAQISYPVARTEIEHGTLDALERMAEPARRAGLRVEFGGTAYGTSGVPVSGKETVGLGVALLVLVVTFGSLLAAGMPIFTALVGVGVGLLSLLSMSNLFTVSSTAPTLALMLGLAVGVDYTLFILSRHRTQLAAGMAYQESAALATATAGSAVVFAGLTVIIALAGLAVVRLPFLTVMGLGAAGTVAVAVAVAITLLPAIMGFAGARLAPKPGSRAANREQADAEGTAVTGGRRWVRIATRYPALTVLAVVAGLLIIAIPAPGLRLALPDNGSAASDTTQRKAYDLISSAFGPGLNGPLLVVVTSDRPTTIQAVLPKVAGAMQGTPGVAFIAQPQNSPDGRTGVVTVIPKTAPDSEQTKDLVKSIRAAAPTLRAGTEARIAVTGSTAVGIDVSDRLADSLLPFIAVVVGLALLLLLLVFRSLVVPLKATVGFLLTIAASFGAVVAVFQWGWLSWLVRVDTTGPVISFLPIIVIGVLFGLAMDYEVFVVSRIREEFVHTGQSMSSVVDGTRHAARVVTAAALIMFAVFASFVSSEDTIIKSIAFSLAFGVLIDAFAVRMTLVPAVLALTGRGAWWLPGWLAGTLPNLDIEGQNLVRVTRRSTTP